MALEVEIRDAVADDAPFLSDLLAELGYPAAAAEIPPRLSAITAFSRAVARVAVEGAKVVGVITAHIIPSIHAEQPIALLTTLVVAQTHRGKGIGSQLIASIERWAADSGAGRISVVSGLQRDESHLFYEKRDYERTGLRFSKALTR